MLDIGISFSTLHQFYRSDNPSLRAIRNPRHQPKSCVPLNFVPPAISVAPRQRHWLALLDVKLVRALSMRVLNKDGRATIGTCFIVGALRRTRRLRARTAQAPATRRFPSGTSRLAAALALHTRATRALSCSRPPG